MKRAKAIGWGLFGLYAAIDSIVTLATGYGGAWETGVAVFVLAGLLFMAVCRWRARYWRRQLQYQFGRSAQLDAEKILREERDRWWQEQIDALPADERRRYEMRVKSALAARGLLDEDDDDYLGS